MDDKAHFAGKKILITGGIGFIGSNLARRLDALGAQVSLVDSLIPEYGGNRFNIDGIEKNVRVNISDVRDEHSMRSLVQEQDYLFNLAGQTSHLDSMQDPHADLEINCRAQLSILETCRKHNPKIKIIFASTRQLYGKPDYLPVDEKHLLRPVDVNGINKMAGEWYHILYNNVYGLRACALRLTNTYGPRMRIKDARQTFLGIWIRLLVEKKSFEVWEGAQRNCNRVRAISDADDVARAKKRGEFPFKCRDFRAQNIPAAFQHARDGAADFSLMRKKVRLGIALKNHFCFGDFTNNGSGVRGKISKSLPARLPASLWAASREPI